MKRDQGNGKLLSFKKGPVSGGGGVVTPYDFRRQDRGFAQLETLRAAHEGLAIRLATDLSAYLRTSVPVRLAGLEQTMFAAFQERLTTPTCLVSLKLAPSELPMVLELDPPFVLAVLETLLGGGRQPASRPKRPATSLEWSLLEPIAQVIAHGLGQAWADFRETEFEVQSLTSDPVLVTCMAATDAVISVRLKVSVLETAGMIQFAVPEAVFETRVPQAERLLPQADAEHQSEVLDRIQDAEVELEVRFPETKLKVRELAELAPDQVLMLGYRTDTPLEGLLNQERALFGQIVANGDKRAFLAGELSAGGA